MHWTLGLCTLFAGLFVSSLAAAQSVPHEHDGLYVRLGVGAALASGNAELEDSGADADISGVAFASELAIGGTLAPGLVLGAGAYQMIIPSPKYESAGGDVTLGAHHAGTLGPFVDYYFNPKQGFHAQAALLLSFLVVDEKDDYEGESGAGFGAMAGVGYEFWIGDQWSVGPLLRLTYSRINVKGNDTDVEANVTLLAPALLVGFTYH